MSAHVRYGMYGIMVSTPILCSVVYANNRAPWGMGPQELYEPIVNGRSKRWSHVLQAGDMLEFKMVPAVARSSLAEMIETEKKAARAVAELEHLEEALDG